jgi:hypothetical protein
MTDYQVNIEAKIISCTDHFDFESADEALKEALDDIRADGYEIISYDAAVEERD